MDLSNQDKQMTMTTANRRGLLTMVRGRLLTINRSGLLILTICALAFVFEVYHASSEAGFQNLYAHGKEGEMGIGELHVSPPLNHYLPSGLFLSYYLEESIFH